MKIKNFLTLLCLVATATSMQAMNQQGAGAGAAALQFTAALPADLNQQPWHVQIAVGALTSYASLQQNMPAGAAAEFRTRMRSKIESAVQFTGQVFRALRQQVVLDEAIDKVVELITASEKSKLSKEEQAKFFAAEIQPLLELYRELKCDKCHPIKIAEQAGKSAEEIAKLLKRRTSATFGALLEYYMLMNPELSEGVAEKA